MIYDPSVKRRLARTWLKISLGSLSTSSAFDSERKEKEALPGESRRRRRSDQSRLRRCAGPLRQRQACVAHLHSRRDPSPRRRTHGRRSYRQQSRRRRRRRRCTRAAVPAVAAAAVAAAAAVVAVALGRLSTSLSLSLQSMVAVAARLPPAPPRSCCS